MGYEPSLSPYFPRGSTARKFRGGPVHETVVDEAERQLDHFADLLDGLGITVRRPDKIDHRVSAKTPDWEVPGGHASACPRDLLLVIGNEIIEAPMAQRARYFEFRAYRTLLKEYFRGGARWTTAPKPLMANDLYNERQTADHEPFDFAAGPLLTEFEPAFDAACFARFGRDIFWRPDLVSNDFGVEWLRRHLEPTFRIHRISRGHAHAYRHNPSAGATRIGSSQSRAPLYERRHGTLCRQRLGSRSGAALGEDGSLTRP